MRIFVSHSHLDRDFVRRLSGELARHVDHVWYSEWSMLPGDSLIQKINEGIHESSTLIAVISKNSVGSAWVQKELRVAHSLVIGGRLESIIPVVIDDVDIKTNLPFLDDILYADFANDYDNSIRRLKAALGVKLSRKGIRGLPPRDDIAVHSVSAWDIMGWEATEFSLFWEIDVWNRVAEFYITEREYCPLRIQLTDDEWRTLRGFRRLDIWKPLKIVEKEKQTSVQGRLVATNYDTVIKGQYISDDGVFSIMAWAISTERAERIEAIRVVLYGE